MNQPNDSLAEFQTANCGKGCRFANRAKVGTGLPCCYFAWGPIVVKEAVCYSRATRGNDPKYICQVCKKEVQYSELPGGIHERQRFYERRVCGDTCVNELEKEATVG